MQIIVRVPVMAIGFQPKLESALNFHYNDVTEFVTRHIAVFVLVDSDRQADRRTWRR